MPKIVLLQSSSNDTSIRLTKSGRGFFTNDIIINGRKFEKKQSLLKDIEVAKQFLKNNNTGFKLNQVGFLPEEYFKLYTDKNFIVVDLEKKEKKVEEQILIGTDPEFLFIKDNRIQSALNFNLGVRDKFGADGAMAEIRPNPAFTPKELIKNITEVFKEGNVDTNWIAECYKEQQGRDYPVGSHIHFDNPKNLQDVNKEALFATTNKILDELLALPLIRMDGNKGYFRRAYCLTSADNGWGTRGRGYGYFGEYRTNTGHLEYRSVSGLMLSNPELCEAIFGVGKAIVEAIYYRAEEKNFSKEFTANNLVRRHTYNLNFNEWNKIKLANEFNCTMSSKKLNDLMNKSSRNIISISYIKDWLGHMKDLSTYGKYSTYINYLADFLSQNSRSINSISKNIKKNWVIV